jgi:predicted nucleic acid-binding protein
LPSGQPRAEWRSKHRVLDNPQRNMLHCEHSRRIQPEGVHQMQIPKIYLETTMFNYYFDTDRDAHADTVTLFEECAAGKFEPYTSDYTLEELERTADAEKREKMLKLIERFNITVLTKSDEANELADKYILEGALPPGSLSDARHIAITSISGLDTIVSLNFNHIVRAKTARLTEAINRIRGYHAVSIDSPMGVLSNEKA